MVGLPRPALALPSRGCLAPPTPAAHAGRPHALSQIFCCMLLCAVAPLSLELLHDLQERVVDVLVVSEAVLHLAQTGDRSAACAGGASPAGQILADGMSRRPSPVTRRARGARRPCVGACIGRPVTARSVGAKRPDPGGQAPKVCQHLACPISLAATRVLPNTLLRCLPRKFAGQGICGYPGVLTIAGCQLRLVRVRPLTAAPRDTTQRVRC
eukprot:364652-Chlamydomonas_euryale.AAC.5